MYVYGLSQIRSLCVFPYGRLTLCFTYRKTSALPRKHPPAHKTKPVPRNPRVRRNCFTQTRTSRRGGTNPSCAERGKPGTCWGGFPKSGGTALTAPGRGATAVIERRLIRIQLSSLFAHTHRLTVRPESPRLFTHTSHGKTDHFLSQNQGRRRAPRNRRARRPGATREGTAGRERGGGEGEEGSSRVGWCAYWWANARRCRSRCHREYRKFVTGDAGRPWYQRVSTKNTKPKRAGLAHRRS